MTDNLTAEPRGEYPKIKTHFAQIIVGGTAKKPYYNIMYFDPAVGDYRIGFGSYFIDNVFKWLEEEFEVVETRTNADRMRSMSDNEVAEFFASRIVEHECLRLKDQGRVPTETQKKALFHNLFCTWLRWLKQPVKDGEN